MKIVENYISFISNKSKIEYNII